MHVANGKLVMDRKNCEHCTEGQQASRIACPVCKGTGKGKRGGRNGCHKCHGMRDVWSWDHPQTCTTCNGNYVNFAEEDRCDYMPDAIWQGMTFRVYRHDRAITLNESVLGLGCVFSCSDYGRAWGANDDAALIADVKAHGGHQATKVSRDDGILADHIGIFVSRGGYSVRAVFESVEDVERQIARERPDGECIGATNIWLVIGLNDGRISSVTEGQGKAWAIAQATKLATELGATEDDATISRELEENGDYIPNKHPEWSVAVHEVVSRSSGISE